MKRECIHLLRLLTSRKAITRTVKMLAIVIAIVIIAVAGVAAYMAMNPPVTYAGGNVKILGLYPFSGSLATYGETIRSCVEWYTNNYVNTKGGINSLGGVNITFNWVDVTSDPATAAIVAETELTKAEKPAIVLGSYSSKLSIVTAPVAQKYKIPMHIYTGSEPVLTYNYTYVFRSHGSSMMAYRPALEFVAYLEETGKSPNVVLINENTLWGHSSSEGLKMFLDKMGIPVSAWEEYDSTALEFTGLVSKLKAVQTSDNPAEVLIWTGYLLDTTKIIKTMKEMDVNFPYVTMSCTDIALLTNVGAKDIEDFTSCTYTLGPAAEKVVPEIGSAFKAHFGRRMTDVDAMAVDQAMCIQNVLEAAKSTDPEEIRSAFYRIDYTGPAGRVKFETYKVGGMTGMLTNQNPYAASLMIQWRNGTQVVVWIGPGEYYPTGIIENEVVYTYSQDWVESDIVYPMHTWSEKG